MAHEVDAGWADARWVDILDRIDHRQLDVGLRFWGPPLWLEVTMTGPDSDLWPAFSDHSASWDWQSSTTCTEVADLADEGAGDDRLLDAIARYTIENLILNAVHEIGEWFRYDGRRLFPAHPPGAAGSPGFGDQGNGGVNLRVEFGPAAHRPSRALPGSARDPRLVTLLTEAAPPSRFTYLPGTAVSYEAEGPVIRRWSGGEPAGAWRSTWSSATVEEVVAGGPEILALVGRDVHRAVVSHEADRICRAFHVDRRRPWSLAAPEAGLGADPADNAVQDTESLSILIGYPAVALTGAR